MLLDDVRDEKEVDAQRDFDIRWTANSMYSASMDTVRNPFNSCQHSKLTVHLYLQTITVVLHFMLAMLTKPEVLKKAQQEIDAVVGKERLPSFEDRASLPYLECVMSEVLRWGVAVPMGMYSLLLPVRAALILQRRSPPSSDGR
jgi:hypothetical protein